MGLLNRRIGLSVATCALAAVSLLYTQVASAAKAPNPKHIEALHAKKLCVPAEEYIKTVEFLRKIDYVKISEANIRLIADDVSKHCNGAADRFQQTFKLLKGMGVSYKKSLELALEFSKEDDEVQENFFAVLKLAYVEEILDFNIQMALDVAYQFSIHMKSHHRQARQDFIDLAKHCRSDQKLGLPLRTCAQIAIKISHLSPYFPRGIYKSFDSLIQKMRSEKQFGLSVREAMETVYEILRHGPNAADSFIKAFDFATSDKGLKMEARKALDFSLTMAQRSTPSMPPPVVDETATQ